MDYRKFNLEGEIKGLLNSLSEADHPVIAAAESIVLAGEVFLSRLLEIRRFHRTSEVDDLVASTIDGLADVVGRATREAEDSRVNGAFYRAIDAANARREG